MSKLIDSYNIYSNKVLASIEIIKKPEEFVPIYNLIKPTIEPGTLVIMEEIKERLVSELQIKVSELIDPSSIEELKKKFYTKSLQLINKLLPNLAIEKKEFMSGILVNEMLGLGDIEILLSDPNLEEIVINSSKEPVWVYHKKYGWLKTSLILKDEQQIQNYASNIGRKVGRQISILNPLLDAHLTSGDRVNATLFPISTTGNTITIRMFRRNPWTITDLIVNKTTDIDIISLLWLAIEYEMNVVISGGTGSGKTSFLNALMFFVPPNNRIISIEDTRELRLPDFLHWVPLTTREPNAEGKGEVDMLDLLVNSLRMRPDRIVVGEIRKERQAEVLFEAMHTGHSVYSTVHADTAEQTYKRLTNPPINIPEALLDALDLAIVMYRDRRTGKRRVYQIAEFSPESKNKVDVLFSWNAAKDNFVRNQKKFRFLEKIKMHTGMSNSDIEKTLKERSKILNWMVKNKVTNVNGVGKIIAEYYMDPKNILKIAEKNENPDKIIPKEWLK
ncbi:MAG: type II/IV secretion system ATPase subunit [Candidatus Aenigmatarchaeota archaeon]|nr:type II/IV secretion system ATPase subunit [Candidatus Aenigmarchaeota archaeon]